MKWQGRLQKLQIGAGPDNQAQYTLHLQGQIPVPLNQLLGKECCLEFQQQICCSACNIQVKKTYHDGYCFRCYQTLAACDQCIFQPERCHFAQGTCRQGEWGLGHCFVPHVVYLAWTSGLKVGITRQANIPTRWLDQGAVAALPLIRVASRYHAGKLEQLFAQEIADKTNWKKMLAPPGPVGDLVALRDGLFQQYRAEIQKLADQWRPAPVELLATSVPHTFHYPVAEFPTPLRGLSLETHPLIRGKLLGIKGQYLLFAEGVINIRKHTGYQVSLHIEEIA